MELETKVDNSVYYFIKTLFASFPEVTVVDSFPAGNLVIPSVSVDAAPITVQPYELGNRNGIYNRMWNIDVFAKSKTQRDEMGYKVLAALKDDIPVYDFDMGFPPTVSPTIIDYLEPRNLRMSVVNINPNLVSTLYFRANISFTTKPVLF
jgi:hypothetical protein